MAAQAPFILLGVYHKAVSQTAPDNTIGANGDLGLDAASNVYQKQAGAWVLLTTSAQPSSGVA
jgi:hypothetical protein